ncbi:crotonase/enoyl-CoA hydratase family protein [Falsigemmobacter faecalis]|uniref:Crotonase/enoyl-CoA hydratase family protein n=1 Tax=Falsigemmobacter faecalis TaxID=2488730 RepID=A0A3P3DXH5_9RHOB|nr:crotonase/enoyl-CoA hydratase family protein [Falsigemmobacter faecalis]RRH78192.1 crotonase/enoyl-CoA hydratase family protein [Falsigemmobacter faecalis]
MSDQTSPEPAVLTRREGAVCILTLNRPTQRNSVNLDLTRDLRAAVKAFEADDSLQVAVLQGAGKVFCAGMDLKFIGDPASKEVISGEGRFAGFVDLPRRKPVIAAVHGAALAGGLEIMLACDMAVAERSARFGLPEPKVGLVAAAGGIMRLAARLPAAKARELVLTGRSFDAEEAERLGLLTRVTEDGGALAEAMRLAEEIAANAPLSIRAAMEILRAAERASEADRWADSERVLPQLLTSDDAREGPLAFVEKRAPRWSGR